MSYIRQALPVQLVGGDEVGTRHGDQRAARRHAGAHNSSTSQINVSFFFECVCREGSSGVHFGGSVALYRGVKCPLQGGQVPIIGGSDAHYRGDLSDRNGSVEVRSERV